jgi:hypothetical protein
MVSIGCSDSVSVLEIIFLCTIFVSLLVSHIVGCVNSFLVVRNTF